MKNVIILGLIVICHAKELPTRYMENECNTTINFSTYSYQAIRLKLTASNSYRSNLNCYLKIRVMYSSQLMLYINSMDVEGISGKCSSDYLNVWDGSDRNSFGVYGLEGRHCGNSSDKSVHKTTTNYLYLEFLSDDKVEFGGFEMIITSFHIGKCFSFEYSCDNGRCIDKSLTCNDYNPCGDHSDCPQKLAPGIIAGIVIGGLLFIGIIIAIVIFFVLRRCRRKPSAGIILSTSPNNYSPGPTHPVSYPEDKKYSTSQNNPTEQKEEPLAS